MKRHLGQKIAFVAAILCYAAGLGSAVAAFVYEGRAPADPVRASLMAAVVFFVGCGIVLHVIGTARLTGIISGRNEKDEG